MIISQQTKIKIYIWFVIKTEFWIFYILASACTQSRDIIQLYTPLIFNFFSQFHPGLSDLTADDDWQWVDCTESNAWQNRLWAMGYPTCDDTHDCAILNPDGTIQDDACDLRINSICEISPKGNIKFHRTDNSNLGFWARFVVTPLFFDRV